MNTVHNAIIQSDRQTMTILLYNNEYRVLSVIQAFQNEHSVAST